MDCGETIHLPDGETRIKPVARESKHERERDKINDRLEVFSPHPGLLKLSNIYGSRSKLNMCPLPGPDLEAVTNLTQQIM